MQKNRLFHGHYVVLHSCAMKRAKDALFCMFTEEALQCRLGLT